MPILPIAEDPHKAEQRKREQQKQRALEKLSSLAGQGASLKRHVFFVPGWTGEEGKAWKEPYPKLLKGHGPVKSWIEKIVQNPDRVTYVSYVDFSSQESKNSRSFLDFGELLKARVRSKIAGSQEPVDLIGHSMGGLDILAAITQGEPPLDDEYGDFEHSATCDGCETDFEPSYSLEYANDVLRRGILCPACDKKKVRTAKATHG